MNTNKDELEKAIHSRANDIRCKLEDLEDLVIILGMDRVQFQLAMRERGTIKRQTREK